jgi:flavin-dependent trigonelline monooxygenase, oxygenase component
MQFGIELGGYWPSHRKDFDNLFPEMLEVVKLGDKVGLDAFIIGEHHFMDFGCTPSPLALACHIAAMSSARRLVTAILMLPMHDAPIMAEEIAMADHLTKGRLEIGFGRGGAPYEYLRTCKPSDMETTRKIFEERLEALKLLFTQQDVSFDREFTKFDKVTIMPPVFQRPHPPIWMTCMRSEATFHCAKNGDHVFTSQLRMPISFVEELVSAFREGVAQSKQSRKPELALLQWVYVAKDDADAREKLEMAYVKQQKHWGILHNLLTVTGGRIPPVPIEETLEGLAKGVIIGTKNCVEDRIQEIADLGIDLLAMKTGFGQSSADELASLERLGKNIIPKLQNRAPQVVAAQ